jgi:indolepyruvate ferredoxin oxidoreductase alpha subunit
MLYSPDDIMTFCLGNEAIARGLIEAGVQLAAGYPGTPTSEILGIMPNFRKIEGLDYYLEWSTNEAVALEVAAAGAQTGIRSAFTAKHVGLNVAMDALMTLAYSGIKGGLVLIIGDDPSLHSSQNEQDTRYFGKASYIPILDPSTPQEAYEMTKYAFEFSEQFLLPVILRITTRVAHAREIVHFKKISPIYRKPVFEKDVMRLVNVPAIARQNHIRLVDKRERLGEFVNTLTYNKVIGKIPNKFGVITSGVAFSYALEAIQVLNLEDRIPILKLGLIYPIAEKTVANFLKEVETALIFEEVEPILETDVRVIAQVNRLSTKILGKREGYTNYFGELNTKIAIKALQDITKVEKVNFTETEEMAKEHSELLPNRPPILCAGCPHRGSFLIVKKALGKHRKDAIFTSDIGCYALGLSPPANVADTLLCMGASIGMGAGLAHSGIKEPVVAIIGDSTFWHSGLPALANAVYNNADLTIMVVDNLTTAMTGMQDHPGTGIPLMPIELNVTPVTPLSIEKVVKAMNIPVIVVDPWEIDKTTLQMKELMEKKTTGPRVIVSRRACTTDALRRAEPHKSYYIDHSDCIGCDICINQLGCPAILRSRYDEHKPIIDTNVCNSCSICAQICPKEAIYGERLQYSEN